MRGYELGTVLFLSLPLGAVVVFVALIALTGSLSNAWTLLAMSLICTLGLALIFWVPLCAGTGMLLLFGLLAAYRALQRTTGAQIAPLDNLAAATQPDRRSHNIHYQALADYIRKAEAKGTSAAQIEARLAAQGWSEQDIEQARALLTVEAGA